MECECGKALDVRYAWNGLDWTPRFYSEGVDVDHCPRCGEALGRWTLEDKNPVEREEA